MNTVIELSADDYTGLIEHLLPVEPEAEEAAFMFASPVTEDGDLRLHVVDKYIVKPDEFRVRTLGHLELHEDTHERMIKRAHDLGAAIVEMHSHPYQFERAACFSKSDRAGLAEIVPQVMWRLPGRPYAALVVAPSGLDALIWTRRKARPRTVDAILVGNQRIVPTGYTRNRGWRLRGSL